MVVSRSFVVVLARSRQGAKNVFFVTALYGAFVSKSRCRCGETVLPVSPLIEIKRYFRVVVSRSFVVVLGGGSLGGSALCPPRMPLNDKRTVSRPFSCLFVLRGV